MTKGKFHIIILIFVLGLFFTPNTSFACEVAQQKIEKTCCTKKATNVDNSKSCCDSSSTSDKEDSCKGKCGNSSCTTSAVKPIFFGKNEIVFQVNFFEEISKKSKFHNNEGILLNGFLSIWLIPKIS